MNTIKINKKDVKLIAHRGLSGIERENSVAAFIAAANRSYYGIETDVHETADGHLVLLHDNNTGRVADGALTVEEETLAQLQQLRLKPMAEDGAATRRDLVIPTLADYIAICRKYDKVAVLEIKPPFTTAGLEKVIALIREYGHLEKTVFISFIWEYLVELRRLLPDQPLQFLADDCREHLEEMVALRIGLDNYFPRLEKDIMDTLHANGLPVNCWTVDTPAEGEKLVELGVDFITTDILE